MAETEFVDATFYAQVEPEWYRYGLSRNDPKVSGAKVVRITQNRPTGGGSPEPKGGTVVVKLVLRLPRKLFEPLRPEAVVTISSDLAEIHPVEVQAVEPGPVDHG